jgi:transposase-like protein
LAKSILTAPRFHDEAAALAYVEARVWPNGPTCAHCGNADAAKIGTLKGKSTRLGVRKCYECRKPFTVKVGTIFESSHVPLHLWLQAIHLLCASKKGMSSNQLHRVLGITLKSAWFLSHRIRLAMKGSAKTPLGGAGKHVEADETFIGQKDGETPARGFHHKRVVFSLVERGGEVRSFHVDRAKAADIYPHMRANLDFESTLNTDEAKRFVSIGKEFAAHQAVDHHAEEYVRGTAHTNPLEGFYSIFKRGMRGIYQHCGERHLHRYLSDFDFRYNARTALGVDDAMRADLPPSADEAPYFYALLSDDKLVTHLEVDTDTALEPDPADPKDEEFVRLVISVEIRPYRVDPFNLNFA